MKKSSSIISVLLSVLLLSSGALVTTALAQVTTATILGTVSDQNGSSIPQALVTVKNVETGISRSATTDDSGRYRVSALPPGKYEVTAALTGFSTELRTGIELTVGREALVDFALRAGKVDERVTVVGEAPLVNTTSSELAGLVDERRIVELPLNGRDVFQLTTLQVGVANTNAISSGGPMDIGPGKTRIAVNGSRTTSNNFLLDGTSVNDAFNSTPGGLSGGFAGVDAIREFEMLTNNYGAEYSSFGGAIVNAISKSGVNLFHGTAFEFLRNSALDAKNFFDVGKIPPFKRNQFGGSFGGPIKKDKSFFFAAYEGLRERLGVTNIFSVPDAASRASAAASVKPYVNLYPQPNGPELGGGVAQYFRSASNKTTDDFVTGRVDHQFSYRDVVFGRYTLDNSNLFTEDGVIQNTATTGRNQYLTIGEDHIFSPNVINTFRFGFDRSLIKSTQPFSVDVPASLDFVPGVPLGSFYFLGGSPVAPLSFALYTPRFFAYNMFEFSDQVSITRGAHAIKAGFLGKRFELNAASNLVLGGVYIYSALGPTITSLTAFLQGLPVAFEAPTPSSSFYRGIRESNYGSFVKDDWKVSSRLTLNLGVRYDMITTPTEANNKVANLLRPTDPAPTVGASYFQNPTKKNFEPRLGFAWDITGDGRTSLRGGYGIFDLLILPFDYRYPFSDLAPFVSINIVSFPPFPPFPNAYSVLPKVGGVQSINAVEGFPKRAYMQQWNLSLQREVFRSLVVTLAYAGSKGTHLPINNELSIRTDGTIINGHEGYPVLPAGVSIGSKRLNPNFGQLSYIQWEGNSNYNSLQIRVDKRVSHGLGFQASYTYAKAIDDADGSGGLFANQAGGANLQNAYDTHADRARAQFDLRHSLAMSATYLFPRANNLKGIASTLVNGWEANAILTAHSGYPFSVYVGFDRANQGSLGAVTERPDIAPGRSASSAVTGDPSHYIDPSAFVLQPVNTLGNAGRDILTGPGLVTFDLGLFKNTHAFGERLNIQFRAEIFNLFNRTNFANPSDTTVFSSAAGAVPGDFGKIVSTTTPSRQIQFGLKFVF